MFLRFVTNQLDPRSGRRQGMFVAAKSLRASGRLSGYDEQRLDIVRDWFSENLRVPDRFSLSARPNRKPQAISWFKDGSSDCLANIREYKAILEEYGLFVEMIKTDKPGFVVFEDEHQVVAYPFADTPT